MVQSDRYDGNNSSTIDVGWLCGNLPNINFCSAIETTRDLHKFNCLVSPLFWLRYIHLPRREGCSSWTCWVMTSAHIFSGPCHVHCPDDSIMCRMGAEPWASLSANKFTNEFRNKGSINQPYRASKDIMPGCSAIQTSDC